MMSTHIATFATIFFSMILVNNYVPVSYTHLTLPTIA